jgi:hypothetical protein
MAARLAERASLAAGASALGCGAITAGALAGDVLPASAMALAIPIACAAAVGATAAVAGHEGWPGWQRRDLATAVLLAMLAGSVTSAWYLLRPALSFASATGLVTVGDAAFLLPGLLVWSAAKRPGAVALGLLAATVVLLAVVRSPFAALTLLAAPVVVAPAELWFLIRGPGRSGEAAGLVGAGVLLGLSSAAAAGLLNPGAAADWTSLTLERALAGAVAGFVAARLAPIRLVRSRGWGLGPTSWLARTRL